MRTPCRELKKEITMNNIPPKGFFMRKHRSGIAPKLRKLNIGDFVEMPHKQAQSSYNSANQIGIKIITRRIDKDTTRVYRVE